MGEIAKTCREGRPDKVGFAMTDEARYEEVAQGFKAEGGAAGLTHASARDEVLYSVEEYPPLLELEKGKTTFEVDAVCRSVSRKAFSQYKETKLHFVFQIVEPEKWRGIKLDCYAPLRKWKKGVPPRSSKVAKMAAVATRSRRRQRIVRAVFVGKLFRCRVRESGDEVRYSVIDTILEVLVG